MINEKHWSENQDTSYIWTNHWLVKPFVYGNTLLNIGWDYKSEDSHNTEPDTTTPLTPVWGADTARKHENNMMKG